MSIAFSEVERGMSAMSLRFGVSSRCKQYSGDIGMPISGGVVKGCIDDIHAIDDAVFAKVDISACADQHVCDRCMSSPGGVEEGCSATRRESEIDGCAMPDQAPRHFGPSIVCGDM